MVKDNDIVFKEYCEFCNKEFKALNESQAISYRRIHELTCIKNPSNIKQNVKNI